MSNLLKNTDQETLEIDLMELFKLLLKNIWVIILVTLLGGGGTFAYASFVITPMYTSSVKLYVNNTTYSDYSSVSSSDISAAESLVDAYAAILESYPTLNAVAEQMGDGYTYDKIASMISTESVNSTAVFKVTVTSADPVEAAEIANAIAEIAPGEIMDVVTGSSAQVVEYARVATSPSSPRVKRMTCIGALVGLLISAIGVIVVSMVQDSPTMEEKLNRDFKEKAVLAVIPYMGKPGNRKKGKVPSRAPLGDKLSFAASESYKRLRENLTFTLDEDKDCHIIGVTSSVRGEGKSTTSLNLAYTLSLSDYRVCLVDCDFRLPSIAKSLRLEREPGITDYLIGKAGGSDVFQKVRHKSGQYFVVAAGVLPPNPSELLGSSKMQKALASLSKNFDYIILDLPPIGVVSDALTVSKSVEGMLFVVREDFYDRKLTASSLAALDASNVRLLGMAVTHSNIVEKKYSRYGKKYGYEYGYGNKQ